MAPQAQIQSCSSVLRHSFATRCIEKNMNLRYIQNMLELNSPKTTKPKTIHINNKNIESPLGYMLKNISFKP